jgi:subtilisin family serine protease
LNRAGFVSSLATIESYSNIAGSDSSVSSRFLVASGTTPFSNGYMARNGVAIEGTTFGPDGSALSATGTSYAAPRVAGYVAILRSKFPNLDAVKSSSIILDTARYDTLTCHPNCDPTIYGKGEASLSRALAPVGRLR